MDTKPAAPDATQIDGAWIYWSRRGILSEPLPRHQKSADANIIIQLHDIYIRTLQTGLYRLHYSIDSLTAAFQTRIL